jgi:glycosyltransferase involved in cell wall biosynthesis
LHGDGGLMTQAGAQTVFFDATLIQHHGFVSPMGIVRVAHYVAEYFARDESIVFAFVIFDPDHKVYRTATTAERDRLRQIIFHRYTTRIPEAEGEPVDTIETTRSTGFLGPWHRLATWFRLAASPQPDAFVQVFPNVALTYPPVRPNQSVVRRVAVRLFRRVLIIAARSIHRIVRGVARLPGTVASAGRRLVDPDPITTASPQALVAAGLRQGVVYNPFRRGDVLLSMANTWDYMDYRYLAGLGRDLGVRLICVVYDVIGMELPFATPSPAHLYHRHWVEIGHASERLVAISRFSADSYRRFISRPNGINVPVDYALLPNFLKDRAGEIGESAVTALEGRNFVVYCSTIEVRKNHILLLHLWDSLREQIAPERLPVLVFVGKWGWYAETVRLLSERNWSLRPCLRILNETSDAELIWLYRHARFTVFPSLGEGFGLGAAESLSFGTPVVVSDCPALQEATEGLMPALHPLDFVGWRKELTHLMLDDDYLLSLREKASQFCGPAYDTFAEKIRVAALSPPHVVPALNRLVDSGSEA